MAFCLPVEEDERPSRPVGSQLKKQLPGKTDADLAVADHRGRSMRVKVPLAEGNPKSRDSVAQIQSAKAVFPRRVVQADAALGGFRLPVRKKDDDRNFFEHQVGAENVTVGGNVVSFEVHTVIQDENDSTGTRSRATSASS
jgi:hypothetical protein